MSSERFVAIFGRPPEGCWQAPGRVNIIGEYTDLNGGPVLPIAIPQATRAWAARRTDRRLRLVSVQQDGHAPLELEIDGPARPDGWAAYPLAVARALTAQGHGIDGVDVLFDSDVPIGAGLSSSAALECSVAIAIGDLFDVHAPAMQTALTAQKAENDYVGVPCGIMDQAASMCCTDGHALLLETATLQARQVPFDLAVAGLCLVVVDTRVKHDLVESAYAQRKQSCQDAAKLLGTSALCEVPAGETKAALDHLQSVGKPELERRARHVFSEQARVYEAVDHLTNGRTGALGPVLLAGHQSLRDDFEVSCPELDVVVEEAMRAGALGARLTGAGFGGSAIALVHKGTVVAVEAGIGNAFRQRGWGPPDVFTVTPSGGAHRVS